MIPHSMSGWFAPLGLLLLQVAPSTGATVSQTMIPVASSDSSDGYWCLNPAEALEQLPQTMRDLQEVSRDLFKPDQRASVPTPEPVWAAMDRYLRVLFMVMVYSKTGVYPTNSPPEATWQPVAKGFERPLRERSSLFGFQNACQEVLDNAETDPPCHPRNLIRSAAAASQEIDFRAFTKAPHRLLAEKTAPLLGIMSLLAAKAFRVNHKLRGLCGCVEESVFKRPGFSYLASNPEAIKNDLGDIKTTLLEFKARLPEYLRLREQAELDLNTQSILDTVEPIFTKSTTRENQRLYGELAEQLYTHNPLLVPLLEEIFVIEPFLLIDLKTPLRESLAALRGPEYREGRVKLMALVKGDGARLPEGVSEADFETVPLDDERLVSWLKGKRDAITEIAWKFDLELGLQFAYHQEPLISEGLLSDIVTYGVGNYALEDVIQVVEQALAKAELVPALARRAIVPIALGRSVDCLELGIHLREHLRYLTRVLTELHRYIWRGNEYQYESTDGSQSKGLNDMITDLQRQWRQPEILSRLEAVRSRLDKIIGEFEALPLCYLRSSFEGATTEIEPCPSFIASQP